MDEQGTTSQSDSTANQIDEDQSETRLKPPPEHATYKHRPLDTSVDEIRLLKLRKDKEGPVHCQIEVFPLKHAPDYIALSYRWGPPSPLHNLYIDGKALKIRDILNSCLLELREDVETWLWIDQICIAQADTLERNHQVGMMSSIYSNSVSVIIWLGDIPMAEPGDVNHYNDSEMGYSESRELLGNDYFTRLWIVQEVLLAKSITIRINGQRQVTWDKLRRLHPEDFYSVDFDPISNGSSDLLILTGASWGAGLSLLECIWSFRICVCENPRDKIYGLMGIVREEERVIIDYNKSVFEVYQDFIAAHYSTRWRHPGLMTSNWIYKKITELGYCMGLEKRLVEEAVRLLQDRITGDVNKLKAEWDSVFRELRRST
jgi:hypothetical protein